MFSPPTPNDMPIPPSALTLPLPFNLGSISTSVPGVTLRCTSSMIASLPLGR